jgi:hypothetical protein
MKPQTFRYEKLGLALDDHIKHALEVFSDEPEISK